MSDQVVAGIEERLAAKRNASNGTQPPEVWLESAADLLSEPDPGPTPFLVENLIVDGAITALQGTHKVGKTWLLTELGLSITTGKPAFGCFEIPEPGPVILVLEESGRAAFHRRLDALRRGYNLQPEDLRDLHCATNRRVRLDEAGWQDKLLVAARKVKPRAIFFDPLARVKGATRDEDSQKEMAPVLDFMRDLREETQAVVGFSHHTGHQGTRLRGSSDLEAYWESKIVLKRDQVRLDVSAEHRESPATPSLSYRLDWDEDSRSMRLAPIGSPNAEAAILGGVAEYIAENPGTTKEMVEKNVTGKASTIREAIDQLLGGGTTYGTAYRSTFEYRDDKGRVRHRDGLYLTPQAASVCRPTNGTRRDEEAKGTSRRPAVGGPIRPLRDEVPPRPENRDGQK